MRCSKEAAEKEAEVSGRGDPQADRRRQSATAPPPTFPPSPASTVSDLSSLPPSPPESGPPESAQCRTDEQLGTQGWETANRDSVAGPKTEDLNTVQPKPKKRKWKKKPVKQSKKSRSSKLIAAERAVPAGHPAVSDAASVERAERLSSAGRDCFSPASSETAFRRDAKQGAARARSRSKDRRDWKKRQRDKNNAGDSATVANAVVDNRTETAFLQSAQQNGPDISSGSVNSGRPVRNRRPPKRLLQEIEEAMNSSSSVTVDDTGISCGNSSSASGTSPETEAYQSEEDTRKRKRPKLARKMSAPNEYGIMAEEAESPESLPLSFSKKRSPVKTCRSTKISARIRALLGLPSGDSLPAGAGERNTNGKPCSRGKPSETETVTKLPQSAVARSSAAAPPAQSAQLSEDLYADTGTAQVSLKTDDLLPVVRASGIRSSTFASVMRIVSGICPHQSSPRDDRLGRPSVAPPVWAQVSRPHHAYAYRPDQAGALRDAAVLPRLPIGDVHVQGHRVWLPSRWLSYAVSPQTAALLC